jgi:hypothetical protein
MITNEFNQCRKKIKWHGAGSKVCNNGKRLREGRGRWRDGDRSRKTEDGRLRRGEYEKWRK